MLPQKIILAGLGPHARRIYYPLLEKYAQQYRLSIPLVIDLQDQADKISRYLADRSLQPERVLFLDESCRTGDMFCLELLEVLDQVTAQGDVHGIIISTEPKAHKPYLLWAIEKNLDILLDKPITAPVGLTTSLAAAEQVWADYTEIEERLKKSRSNVIVQCQRRSHQGYQFIRSYLCDFLQRYEIPISYLNIYHADGMWAMPPELFRREHHPYKYGYGKLMHSGYHFIDLFAWLAELNDMLEHKKADRLELFVKRFRPYDFLHQVTAADYQRLFQTDKFAGYFHPAMLEETKTMGELDVFISAQLKRGEAAVTTASINLQQNSFCRRAWKDTPEDVYKGNGRVRHESLNVQVANLLNVQVHSYQAYEVGKKDVETQGAGHIDHFEVYIFRNSGLIGGQPLEKFCFGEHSPGQMNGRPGLGHNEKAREVHLLDFLNGWPSASNFATHRLTNKLLAKVYECIVRENSGGIPHLSFELDDEHIYSVPRF